MREAVHDSRRNRDDRAAANAPAVRRWGLARETGRLGPGSPIGPRLGSLIGRSRPTGGVPGEALPALGAIPGHTLEKIRIHDDSAAHEAARGLDARAFTIGPSIYFGRGEFRPATADGLRVLRHEAAHAHQQAGASLPPLEQLEVAPPSCREEVDAGRFADTLGTGAPVPPATTSAGTVARVMRLTFEANPGTPKPIPDLAQRVNPYAGRQGNTNLFAFGGGGGGTDPELPYLFSWEGDVTVHGTPDEDYAKWRVGILNTVHSYSLHIRWSDGHECGGEVGPRSDNAADPRTPWFTTSGAGGDETSVSAPYAADGEVRHVKMNDSPNVGSVPYTSPKEGSEANSGKFDWHIEFAAYLSAGYGTNAMPESYQHLKSVSWVVDLHGKFGPTEPTESEPPGPLSSSPGRADHPPHVFDVTGDGVVPKSVVDASREERKPVIGAPSSKGASEMSMCWITGQRPAIWR